MKQIKKFWTLLLVAMIAGAGEAWADDTQLFYQDFTSWPTEEASTKGANTLNGVTSVVFYNNHDSKHHWVTNGTGIELPDNNINSNYFIAIPLTGINQEITVTITHEEVAGKKVTYDYVLGVGETDYSTSTAGGTKKTIVDAENGATSMTATINCTSSNAVLYLGRHNSNSENKTRIESITITTPGSSGTLSLSVASNYTWSFSNNETKAKEEYASETVLPNGSFNFGVKYAEVKEVTPVDVPGLANGITKTVYFDGEGSTSNKYVHVKVQGPSKITVFGKTDAGTRNLVIKCGETTINASVDNTGVTSHSYWYNGTSEQDVYIYSSNSAIYLYGVKVEPYTDAFSFNVDDVLYYQAGDYEQYFREFVNATTFEKRDSYDHLRLKAVLTPDLAELDNPVFAITSSDNNVLDPSGFVFYKASDNRVYFKGIAVKSTGTATLTFNFNGATNHPGTASFSQSFTINEATPPVITLSIPTTSTNAEIGKVIQLTVSKNFSTSGSAIRTDDGGQSGYYDNITVTPAIDSKTPKFYVNTTNRTLTATFDNYFANGTEYTITIPASLITANGGGNAATTLKFTTTSDVSLTPVSDKFWKFTEEEGFPAEISENTIIDNMELLANSSKKMSISEAAKSFTNGGNTINFTHQLKFGGTGDTSNGASRIIHFKVEPGATINVWGATGSNGSSREAAIRVAPLTKKFSEGTEVATLTSSTADLVKGTYTVGTSGDYVNGAEIWVYSKNSGFNISGVQVTIEKAKITLSNSGQATSYVYSDTPASNVHSYEITYGTSESKLLEYESGDFTVSSSNSAVIDASGATVTHEAGKFTVNNLVVKSGGETTLTFRYKGNADFSEASLSQKITVTGKQSFTLSLSDMSIQSSQRRVISPVIIDANGKPISIVNNAIHELADDESADYDNWFDFTYTAASNSVGVSIVDGNVVKTTSGVTGGPVAVTVTATPKEGYRSLFTNGTATGTLYVTVTERASGLLFDFYLDKESTTQVSDVYTVRTESGTSTTFVDDFPNGRLIYLKLNAKGVEQDVKEIWFSTGRNDNAGAVSRYTVDGQPRTIYKSDHTKSLYLYKFDGGAIPVYIDEALGDEPKVTLNLQAYKEVAGSYEQAGSVIPVQFNIVSHDRPVGVTYSPVGAGSAVPAITETNLAIVRSTAQPVDAVGSSGNTVYAKFSSTGTNYSLEGLLNEPNVVEDVERAGVFSTEVADRKISGVQVTHVDGDYIGSLTSSNYWYLYATTLNVTPPAETTLALGSDNVNAAQAQSVTASYYNKALKQQVTTYNSSDSDNSGTVSYTMTKQGFNGGSLSDGFTYNTSTGVITDFGSNAGKIVVTVSYTNPTEYTVNKRTSKMEDASYTYTIFLMDPDAHLPKIEPNSKKFHPSIDVTVTADTKATPEDAWDTYYLIKAAGDDAPTASTIMESGTKVDKNTKETFTHGDDLEVGEAFKVYAVAWDGEGDGTGDYSTIVSETYTKGAEVLPPYLIPPGRGNHNTTYNYYTETLKLEARVQTPGSRVYYTITRDGTDPAKPVVGAPGTYAYDGLQGITLGTDNKTRIRTIAVNEVDDISSEDLLWIYHYSNGITAPYFEQNSAKITTASVDVTTTDNITVGTDVTPSAGLTMMHFYTLDGTEPDIDNGILYTGAFHVIKTVTGKVMTVLVDAEGKVVQSSPATTVVFNVSDPLNVWEAVWETTPGGKLPATDGLVISTDKNLSLNNIGGKVDGTIIEAKVNLKSLSKAADGSSSKTYAQQYVTATFGGYDMQGWESFTIPDAAIGSPIDGVGEYSIKHAKSDVKMEYTAQLHEEGGKGALNATDLFNHVSTLKESVHERTFDLPAKGPYVRFEPEKNGVITVWGLQQGSLMYQEDQALCDKFIRYRPVYVIDQEGHSVEMLSAESSARLSAEWAKIEATAASNGWTDWHANQTVMLNGKLTDIQNKGYTKSESQVLYEMYQTWMAENNIRIGSPIKPFPVHKGYTISQNNGRFVDPSNDNTGYVMITGGYVKYKFRVEAGKTYFFFAQGTKFGVRGFHFAPEEPSATNLTLNDTDTELAAGFIDSQVANVTLNRSFTPNVWTTLVLPFSVPATQVEKLFGAGTDIIHFDNITGITNNIISLKRHWHKMIVAGTPVLIKPTRTEAISGVVTMADDKITSIKFDNVYINNVEAKETLKGSCDDYSMMGTYVQIANGLLKNDYYMNTAGNFKRMSAESATMKGTRAWLRPKEPANAKALTIQMFNFDDQLVDVPSDIQALFGDDANVQFVKGAVYNIKGQMVRSSNESLKGLPKGVYIVNGKKVVVD